MTPAGGYLGGEFMYADPRGPEMSYPRRPAPTRARRKTATTFGELGEAAFMDTYWATIVATFEDETDAGSAAAVVDIPEGARRRAAGTDPAARTHRARTRGTVLDPRIARAAAGSGLKSSIQERTALREGSIVVDLDCTAASEQEACRHGDRHGRLRRRSGSRSMVARPPWVGPPITADEALARSTFRRRTSSFADSLKRSQAPWPSTRTRNLAATSPRTSSEPPTALKMGEHVADQQIEGLGGEEVHPGVVARLAASPTSGDFGRDDRIGAWSSGASTAARRRRRMSPSESQTCSEQRAGAASTGAVQAVGSTVKLGWTSFNRIAIGLPALIGYLGEQMAATTWPGSSHRLRRRARADRSRRYRTPRRRPLLVLKRQRLALERHHLDVGRCMSSRLQLAGVDEVCLRWHLVQGRSMRVIAKPICGGIVAVIVRSPIR